MKLDQNKIFLIIVGIVFLFFTVLFNFLPRSTHSEFEKRKLKEFPNFAKTNNPTEYTKEISSWYSDTEPFRDFFLNCSMSIQQIFGFRKNADDIVVYQGDNSTIDQEENSNLDSLENISIDSLQIADNNQVAVNEKVINDDSANNNQTLENIIAQNDSLKSKAKNKIIADSLMDENVQAKLLNDSEVKFATQGLIVVGAPPLARAMSLWKGTTNAAKSFAELTNFLHDTLKGVNVYCMIIPSAIEFYCPEQIKSKVRSQYSAIKTCYSKLYDTTRGINLYPVLKEHTDEDIYLRTDHHWSPLGGFYAAKEFARVANVPFRDLDAYQQKCVKNFVGTMYSLTKDAAVKRSAEDFIYYEPTEVEYSTTYITYITNDSLKIVGTIPAHKGNYFHKFKDGHSGAYCTFMGGDGKITQVRTSVKNGRRLLIGKDSFGNTFPGYLFYSFEEIHVIDYRYFKENLKKYIKENQITDFLLAHCMNMSCSSSLSYAYRRFLRQ